MVERVRAGAPEISKPTRGFLLRVGGFSYPKTIQPRESRRTDAPAASARSTTVTRRGYFPPRRLTETPKGSRGTVLPVSARLRGPAAGMAQPSRLPSLPPVTEMAGAGEKTERFGGRPCLLGPDPTARDRGAGTYGKTERLRGRPWRRDLLRRADGEGAPSRVPHRNLQNRARRGEASPAFGTLIYDPRGVELKIFQSPDATKAPSDPRGVRDARSSMPVVVRLGFLAMNMNRPDPPRRSEQPAVRWDVGTRPVPTEAVVPTGTFRTEPAVGRRARPSERPFTTRVV
ncbi:hypothetical protein AOLI_G00329630 [Acnodon oligacanthus]